MTVLVKKAGPCIRFRCKLQLLDCPASRVLEQRKPKRQEAWLRPLLLIGEREPRSVPAGVHVRTGLMAVTAANRMGIEIVAPGDPNTTPFVYFVSGTAVFPPNNLRDAARRLLESGNDTAAMRCAAAELAKHGFVGGTRTVVPEAFWYHYFGTFLSYPIENFDNSSMECFARSALDLCVGTPPDVAWAKLRDRIIPEIDDITGWSQSTQKVLAELDKIFKGEDGYFYRHWRDGTLVQVIGGKTMPQVRVDYITDQTLRSYGRLRQFLNVFAAFSISFEFARDPDQFPKSMKATLLEPAHRSTGHHWHLLQYDRTRSVAWRPPSVYCDPEWLAADLMGRITDTLGRNLRKEYFERHNALPNELDAACKYQIDYALDTVVSIGSGEQVFIHFEDKTFRWINGTAETKPIISVGVTNLEDHRTEDESLNRLISIIVWEHRHPIGKAFGAGGLKRAMPIVWAPRSNFGLRVEPQYLFGRAAAPTSRRWLALALYKEGINSQSVFYRFLNLWKVIELAVPDKRARLDWINRSGAALPFHKERVAAILAANPDLAIYLDDSCRNAITHVFRRPIVNPDDPNDHLRISKDISLVTDLSRKAVDEFLPA